MLKEQIKKSKILIVDDNYQNTEILHDFLELEGFENIEVATNPRVALELFEAAKPDIILLDLAMPVMTGFEVMAIVRESLPKDSYLPILVLTADFSPESKNKALASGANDFLTKPFDLAEVLLRIKNLMYTKQLHDGLTEHVGLLDAKVKERTIQLEHKNRELETAWEKAEVSSRLKSEFINNISHEIRTPLNGILGFAELLTDPELTTEEREEFLDILKQSSNRLLFTVKNIMDISLLGSTSFEVYESEFILNSICDELISRHQKECQSKGVEFRIEIPSELGDRSFNTDKSMLLTILDHILQNAVKFTSTGFVRFFCELSDGVMEFIIEDSGEGISEWDQSDIFKVFAQGKLTSVSRPGGTGLGLAISKGFVELLGGNIRLESELGKGTKVFVAVPSGGIAKEPEAVHEIEDKAALKTILIVDDDPISSQAIEKAIQPGLFEIIVVRNGYQAVEKCRSLPDLSLVLMDLRMPQMNGFEALAEIRKFRKDLPVFIITGYVGGSEREKAKLACCDEFIMKPLSPEILRSKLKRYGLLP